MWELDHFEQEGLIIYEHHCYYVLFAGGSKCILGNKLDLKGDICSSLFWGTSTALCWAHSVYSQRFLLTFEAKETTAKLNFDFMLIS